MAILTPQDAHHAAHLDIWSVPALMFYGLSVVYLLDVFADVNMQLDSLNDHCFRTKIELDMLAYEFDVAANETSIWRASVGNALRVLAGTALPSTVLITRPNASPLFPGLQFDTLLAISGLDRAEVVNAHVSSADAFRMAMNDSDDSYTRLIEAGYNVNVDALHCHPACYILYNDDRIAHMFIHGLRGNVTCGDRTLCSCLNTPIVCSHALECPDNVNTHRLHALERQWCH